MTKRAPYQTSKKDSDVLFFCPKCELVFQQSNAYSVEEKLWKGFPTYGLVRKDCKECENKNEGR